MSRNRYAAGSGAIAGARADGGDGAGKLQDAVRSVAQPIRRFFWDIKVEGLERLPAEGPAILCPNHISFLDSAFLMLVVPRRISFIGKAEYMDSWKTKYLFPAMGMIPIDRGGGSKSRGFLNKGHTGAARLAIGVGCPIFPVGIVGTREIQPPDAKLPRVFRSCSITIGRPVKVEKYASRVGDHLALRQLIDEVMFEIKELTGQEYRNRYASKKADVLPSEAAILPEALAREEDLATVG
jgi:1-acyl-sn-glycerol-3-phosphate acyltransferase